MSLRYRLHTQENIHVHSIKFINILTEKELYVIKKTESQSFSTVNELEKMAFSVGFCLNLLAKPQASLIPPVSHSSAVSSFSAKNAVSHHMKKIKHPITQTRASAEGLPSELVEDSKFVPLNADDATYGPPALFLLGFEVNEAEKIRQFLKELDGEFLEIIYCTEDMITRSLWEAVNTRQPNLEEVKIAKSLPRICFFSGLSGEEMMMFIDAFSETGLEAAVFAALVPNSADKPVAELIEEIMGDHEMLTAQQSGST